MDKKEIVLSSSRVNSYGYRVLTNGINTEQYARNPILLWNHNRPFRDTKDVILPIGKIEGLRKDGDLLIGTPVFDEGDEFAKEIKRKFEGGFINMSSIGIDIVEVSEAAEHLVQGQTRATITKSKLREVSLTDIGANDDAVVLYADGGNRVELSAGGDSNIIPKLNFNNNKNFNKMKSIQEKLGLQATSTEADVLLAIGKLQDASKRVDELEKELNAQKKAAVMSEVDRAVEQKKITADKRDHFVEIGEKIGLTALKATFDAMSAAVKPTDVIAEGQATARATGGKKWGDLTDTERLSLRENDVESYKKLYQQEYGAECVIEQR